MAAPDMAGPGTAALDMTGPGAQSPHGPEEVRAALERAFAAPEFAPEGDALARALERFFDWLAGFLDWDLAPGALRAGSEVTLWVVLGLLCALLAVLLLRLAREALPRGRRPRASEAPARVAARVAELRERAREAEAAERWLEALRLYFFALVVGLAQRGDLEYRDAWTNRELLLRGEPAQAIVRVLAPLVRELDARSFGTLEAGPEDVRRFAEACDQLLEGAASA